MTLLLRQIEIKVDLKTLEVSLLRIWNCFLYVSKKEPTFIHMAVKKLQCNNVGFIMFK